MPWLQGVLASIGFFLISIFGGSHMSSMPQTNQAIQPITQTSTTTSVTEPEMATTSLPGIDSEIQWYPLSSILPHLNSGQRDFSIVGGMVIDQGVIVAGADPSSFEYAFDGYNVFDFGKDSQHVYFVGPGEDGILPGADPATFAVIDNDYGEDTEHVYYDGQVIPNASPSSFVVLKKEVFSGPDEFSKDVLHVFACGMLIPDADPTTFQNLTSSTGSNLYSKDKSHVFYTPECGTGIAPIIVADADPATFMLLSANAKNTSGEDAKDANHYYSYGQLAPNPNSSTELGGGYSKDASGMYFDEQLISRANPSTFTVLMQYHDPGEGAGAFDGIGKDTSHVYFDGEPDPTLDPATFLVIDGEYFKDKNGVYIASSTPSGPFAKISNRPLQFSVLTHYDVPTYSGSILLAGPAPKEYATDGISVFADGEPIVGADPASFTVFPDGQGETALIAKDRNHVYDGQEILKGISDIATFKIIGITDCTAGNDCEYASVDNQAYSSGPNYYASDSSHVYFIVVGGNDDGSDQVSIMPGADPATFTVLPCDGGDDCTSDAKDKNHTYLNGQIVQ